MLARRTRIRWPRRIGTLAGLAILAALLAPAGATAASTAPPAAGGTAAPSAGVATTTTPASATSTTATPQPRTSTPASTRAAGAPAPTRPSVHRSTTLSTPAIALAALAGLIVLGGLAWGLARTLAYEPRWVQSSRHALAEGGFRASATWAEFADWARMGR
jgi:hypothetical protein